MTRGGAPGTLGGAAGALGAGCFTLGAFAPGAFAIGAAGRFAVVPGSLVELCLDGGCATVVPVAAAP
ncbi:hypothetical protein [Streptomyces sp. NPDC002205]|uniref:hypothetical protein n=1 Tax=Streptomyces sp. NPDC002205 TaxID=3154411 RepID=UPI00332CE9EE